MTKRQKLIAKAATEIMPLIKKEHPTKADRREYLIGMLLDDAEGGCLDEPWDFISDVLMNGYDGKGYNKMTEMELLEEYISSSVGMFKASEYEPDLNELKERLFGDGENDDEGYDDGEDE